VALDLLNTTLIALGLGLVGAILLRRVPTLDGLRVSFASHGPAWILAVALVAGVVYAIIAKSVFSGRPLLIDEIMQVFQARLLAEGRLWTPAAPNPEFFSSLHLVEQGGRVYSQFPIGGPALLALGTLVGSEWLVGPFFGAIAVFSFGFLVRRIEPRPLVALGALLLFALAPFAMFMSGSHMNHVTALCGIVIGMLFLVRATGPGGRVRDGALCGLGLGIAATIRPTDALAFALPASLWMLHAAVRGNRLGPLLGAGLGILGPLALLGWANQATTGSPFLFGYTVLWGPGHGLGFHLSPWGEPHTPVRGIELINLYLLRLQTYLLEIGLPALLPAAIGFALTRVLGGFDRYLIVASGLLAGLYFAYWHDGFYLGPRFLYPLLPLLALWTARAIPAVRDRLGAGHLLTRAFTFGLAVALVIGLVAGIPARVGQYRSGMLSLRWDADRAAAGSGVQDALVLVRESWGAQLVARLWALEVPRPDADQQYRATDPCRLDSALVTLEERGIRGASAVAHLIPLRADSARLVSAVELTGDPSLQVQPGAHYSAHCVGKLRENQSGFTLFAPLLLARGGGNLYARDLGARDSLLLARYPDRQVYLLKPDGGAVGAEPRFHRLDPDSLRRVWRSGGL
jgi:hypothetical protein